MIRRQIVAVLAGACATWSTPAHPQGNTDCIEYAPTSVTHSGDQRTMWLGWTASRGRSERAGRPTVEWSPPACLARPPAPIPTIFAACREGGEGEPTPPRIEIPPWPGEPDAAVIAERYGIGQALGDWLSENLAVHRWRRTQAAPFYDETVTMWLSGARTKYVRKAQLIRAGENWSTQTYYETVIPWKALLDAASVEGRDKVVLGIEGPGLKVQAAFRIDRHAREALQWLARCKTTHTR